LAGGWGWRLVYTGRAHPLGTFLKKRAARACRLETFLKFLFFLRA